MFRGSIAFAVTLASAALAQEEGGGEDAHVARIGLFVEQHALAGARSVATGALSGDQAFLVTQSDWTSGGGLAVFDGSAWTTWGRSANARDDEPFAASGAAAGRAENGETRVFVADPAQRRVTMLDSSARWQALPAAAFREPAAVALGAPTNSLYVVDRGAHRVHRLSLEGEPLASIGGRGSGEGQFIRPADVAVDEQGFVYVVDTGNHRVQKFDAELRFVQSWGAFGPHPGFFAFPEGVACFEGSVYVADTDNHRVQVFAPDGKLEYEWGLHALAPREGAGKLHYPADVAVLRTEEGLLALVTEPFEDRVQLFRATRPGEELPRRAIPDRVVAAHYGPRLDIAEDLVVLFEPGAPSVLLFDIEHDVEPWEPIQVSRLAAWGRKTGQFRCPNDVAIDPERRFVFVADSDSGVIACYRFAHTRESALEFNPFEFQLVRSLDLAAHRALTTPEREYELVPDALELRPNGELYVLDSLEAEIAVFSPQLEQLRTIDLRAAAPLPSRLTDMAFAPDGATLYVIDEFARRLVLVGADAEVHCVELASPHAATKLGGVAVSSAGELFVSDVANNVIRRYSANYVLKAEFGCPGVARVQFHKPRGLRFDERGRLHVVDWGNHRVQVLTPDGQFITASGSRLFTKPTLPAER